MGILTELSDDQIAVAFENMRKSDPKANDWIEALMNRISVLENKVRWLEWRAENETRKTG